MRTFNHVLFFACLALLGIVAVIQGLPALNAARPILQSAQQPTQQSAPQTAAIVTPAPAAIRPAVGRPLQEAIALYRKGNYREAQQRIDTVNALPGKNATEQEVIDKMRASIKARLSGAPHPI